MFLVDDETPSTVSLSHVIDFSAKSKAVGLPSFASVETATLEPSENRRVPEVIASSRFGRSKRTMRFTMTAEFHVS